MSRTPIRTWWHRLATPGFVLALVIAPGSDVRAQDTAASAALRRIESLYAQRDARGALRIADSILADTDPTGRFYADALYWRGLLSEPLSRGRLDLLRVVVDHPLSARAGDALYQLARQDLLAGDQAGARERLERAMREYAGNQFSSDIAVELGRLLMASGEYRPGCIALDSALARVAVNQVERRNEVMYLRRPCNHLLAEAPATESSRSPGRPGERATIGDSGVRARPPGGESTRPIAGRTAGTRRHWSAQVAAYTTRADAQRSAARLAARGYEARITDKPPYRVRIGRFATRQEAATLVDKLRTGGTKAIVVEAERP